MSKEIVLALDQGSSSSRVLAVESSGRVLARVQKPLKAYYPKPGWVEHDAEEIFRTQTRALDEVLRALPRSANILGAGLAAQRSTVVLWDRETGKSPCRVPSWQDGRAVSVVAPLQGRQAEAHEKTGLYLTPYYSAPKIRWLLDHEPQARKLLDQGRLMIGPVSSYLIWRLTGGKVFAVDPSMAQRMMLFNLRTFDWDPDLLELFNIPRSCLPEIRPSAGTWGSFERLGRKIDLRACLGDQQSATLGLGGVCEGSSVANYGTGAFLLLNTGPRQHRIPGLLTSVGWSREGAPPVFLEEGTVHAAGTSFDWLRDNLGLLKKNSDIDRLCRASKRRVWALPAIGGLGAPRWDYQTRTAFFGLDSQTRPEDLVRGVAEGLAFFISDIAGAMRGGGLQLREVRASGGLSRISYLIQFQADLLGLPITRCREAEVTALGAASLAVEAAGASWAGKLRGTAEDRKFEPLLPGAEAEALRQNWKAFVEAQVALSRLVRN